MATIEGILRWWFGDDPHAANIIDARAPFWFANNENRVLVDNHIRTEYGALFERACRGELTSWTATPHGRLALIIVLDQFSRNLYRDDGRAFAQDNNALEILQAGLAAGEDRALALAERMFFYIPLMHSESLEVQRESVKRYSSLVDEAPEASKSQFMRVQKKSKEHEHCIERFGRYPHRNAVLGRQSTPEELEFLANEEQPGRGAPGKVDPALIAKR